MILCQQTHPGTEFSLALAQACAECGIRHFKARPDLGDETGGGLTVEVGFHEQRPERLYGWVSEEELGSPAARRDWARRVRSLLDHRLEAL